MAGALLFRMEAIAAEIRLAFMRFGCHAVRVSPARNLDYWVTGIASTQKAVKSVQAFADIYDKYLLRAQGAPRSGDCAILSRLTYGSQGMAIYLFFRPDTSDVGVASGYRIFHKSYLSEQIAKRKPGEIVSEIRDILSDSVAPPEITALG